MAEILHVITRSNWGGAQRIVNIISTNTKYDTAVACGTGGKLIDELKSENIPVIKQPHLQSPPNPVKDSFALKKLIKTINKNSFDVVHCHSTKAGSLGRIAAYLTDTPSIFTVHGWGFYNTSYDWAKSAIISSERILARITDAITCVSQNDLNEAEKHNISERSDTSVIHNGIRNISHTDRNLGLYSKANIDENGLVIGAITRLAHQKDPVEILRVAQNLQEKSHKLNTVIIGDGPLRSHCEKYASSLERTHLLGFQENAVNLLSDFDIFLLTSKFEGLPISVLEAMHAGVPVVGYDVGGVAEAVDNGRTGYTVPQGHTEELTKRVSELLESDEKRKAFGDQARQRARTKFSAERMVSDYESLYESIMN